MWFEPVGPATLTLFSTVELEPAVVDAYERNEHQRRAYHNGGACDPSFLNALDSPTVGFFELKPKADRT